MHDASASSPSSRIQLLTDVLPQPTEESVPPTAPGKIVVPSTEEEVVAAIKAAAAQPGGNLRCIGHGNTWTPAFFDEVWPILRMHHLCDASRCSIHACMQGATIMFTSEIVLPSGNRIELAGCAVRDDMRSGRG